MQMKEILRVGGKPDSVSVTFSDDDGVERELTIQPDRPESMEGFVQQLIWLLGRVAPKPGLLFGIASGRALENGAGVVLTTHEGLEITVILDRADLSALGSLMGPKKDPTVH
jgi:hypothetical protein